MSKETLVFILGFIVLISPFLGIPKDYRQWLLVVCGGFLMIIGYWLRRYAFLKSIEHSNGERRGDAFVESGVVTEKIPSHKDNEINV